MLHTKLTKGYLYIVTKIIAIVVCLSMLTLDIGFAAPSNQAAHPGTTRRYSIPVELGLLDESYEGSSGKTVIYIQDAHTSLQAQENIAKIINHLVTTQDVQTVFEEGYEGEVPTDQYFNLLQEKQVKEHPGLD